MDPTQQSASTVPMLSPDGTSGDIPQDRVQDALKAGFKQAVSMTAPDGKTTGYVPLERQQDAVKAGFTNTPRTPAQPAPEGFFHSLASQFGLTPDQLKQSAEQDDAHPVAGVLKSLAGPAGSVLESLYSQGKASLSDIKDAVHAAAGGNPSAATVSAVHAVPIVGPGLVKAAQQAPASTGSYGKDVLGAATDPSTMGTVVGAATQAAPMVADPLLKSTGTAGLAAKAGDAVAGKVLPSAMKANAGQLLQAVAKDANSVPVGLDNAGPSALKLMDWQGKTQLGPTINKFLNRITKPNAPPLTYADARDYYQLLGRLSADDMSKLPPVVQRDLTQMVQGFKTDIGNAADQVGQAANYYKGLGNYSTAMRLQGWTDFAKNQLAKEGIKAGVKAAGAAAGGGLVYEAYKQYQDQK